MNNDIYHLLMALAIGAIIGAEREYRSKSAGLRTMIMVSLASCLFTILSIKIGVQNPDRENMLFELNLKFTKKSIQVLFKKLVIP